MLTGEETLARHERALLDLARRQHFNVTAIYREVVSGETIQARPVMQQLLTEIEDGVWDGVLVMEVERLARGATIDQGVVAQAFQLSGTKIITPSKTYDPNNEFDEEYFEFGLFMSRREYKAITRRMQRGRLASVMEGKYVGAIMPYGYIQVKLEGEKGYTLAPHPEQADIVRLIYDLYVHGRNGVVYGRHSIANHLNDLGVPSSTGGLWTVSSIRNILTNPIYTGKIHWNARKGVKKIENGQVTVTRPRAKEADQIITNGRHPALVDEELFIAAQASIHMINRPSVGRSDLLKNPLAGIIKCEYCRHPMQRRAYPARTDPYLSCTTLRCPNVAAPLHMVEEKVILGLHDLLAKLEVERQKNDHIDSNQLDQLRTEQSTGTREVARLHTQMDSLYDLLEQGVYDRDTFLSRSKHLQSRLDTVLQSLDTIRSDIDKLNISVHNLESLIPKIKHILLVYNSSSPADRNNMLKSVLQEATYAKTTPSYRAHDPADFQVTLYPLFPLRPNNV